MALDLVRANYNPDVLSCLANLSSDEVFTPPEVVNQMLDMLPQELFCNPDTTFLDPATKSGVFLREIAKRLMKGLEKQIPDLQERVDHILKKQLYGIAMTELTSLLARRSVYCSKYPNSNFSVAKFLTSDGNIRYRRITHQWIDEKCFFCGANQAQFSRGQDFETHAYEFVHTNNPEELFDMNFDVIIGNPPYQLATGGGTDESKSATQAKPIYHLFIEQAKKLNPRYLTMIVPARWYSGGMGLNQFRAGMLNDNRIVKLVDFINSKDCFSGVDIAGGVCYFLWDRDHPSTMCDITNIAGEEVNRTSRALNEFETLFIRSNAAISIIKKVQGKTTQFMSDIVSPIDTFGIPSKEKGHKEQQDGDLELLHTKGYNTQGFSYLSRDKVKKNLHLVDKYKVKISIMVPQGGEVGIKPENGYRSISTPQILKPGQVDSFSYLNIGFFDTELEAKNLVAYVKCKFTRYLLRTTYSSVHVSKDNFCFVPLMDFNKLWTDEELYEYFGLDDYEIDLIEKTMRPMINDEGDE
ncbi:Eco57I restriction-modification methylase domain-containing protein [Butyricicoccus sp.]|uniref:Eco57I restriction-modification methylase domain-containing protein n=1 Tax=Butyricicoccus sp. TaxID=2049021 RepID=UPI003AB05C1D